MFHTKQNFKSALAEQFQTTATWRKANAKRFKHDARNAEAEQRLIELQSGINIPDDVWEFIKPIVSKPDCLAAISETNRDVGFRTQPEDFKAWLKNLHACLIRN
jgi:hypothetical protein